MTFETMVATAAISIVAICVAGLLIRAGRSFSGNSKIGSHEEGV